MRRRANRKPETRVALFPFLAVLVCTMGALIVLLVLVVQHLSAIMVFSRSEAPPLLEAPVPAPELADNSTGRFSAGLPHCAKTGGQCYFSWSQQAAGSPDPPQLGSSSATPTQPRVAQHQDAQAP